MIEEKAMQTYLKMLEATLKERYAFSEEEARKRMEKSQFDNLIHTCPELIFQFSPSYWARKLTQTTEIKKQLTHS